MELTTFRKSKVNLSDYDYEKDLENRHLMAEFSTLDLATLEEILYSPLKISVLKLAKNLDVDIKKLLPVLEKLSKTKLLEIQNDDIIVDKEMRKYYEFQILKYDDDFKPDMEFLQGLLRKVPIHILPIWYSLPRSSNNIFQSIIEKYLLTPQVYQRHLIELNNENAVFSGIIKDIFKSPSLKVYAQDLRDKYKLSRKEFNEYMLHFEFNFVLCSSYTKVKDHWVEVVTPFHEWKEYLKFLYKTHLSSHPTPKHLTKKRPKDFSFVEDISTLLVKVSQKPINLEKASSLPDKLIIELAGKSSGFHEDSPDFLKDVSSYFSTIVEKSCLLRLLENKDNKLYLTDAGKDWLNLPIEEKALYLYRNPLNRLLSHNFPSYLLTERALRESEKSIKRVSDAGWVYFDDFMKGVLVSLNEENNISLKRTGKIWKYFLPQYDETEKKFIKASIFEWLFEVGMVATGKHNDKDCFCVTPFGQTFFEA